MQISGMSGNEIYCLSQKGFEPDEIVIGNSVFSLGVGGWRSSIGGNLAGGEVTAITSLISEGRHAAIHRMQEEAKKHGVVGVTGVTSEVRSLAGYTEFLAMGTGVRHAKGSPFFTTSASGIDLYCHIDAGYAPIRFVMGNIAYSLGIGRGLTSSLRQLKRGVVTEFSQMYNEIRHTALTRIRHRLSALDGVMADHRSLLRAEEDEIAAEREIGLRVHRPGVQIIGPGLGAEGRAGAGVGRAEALTESADGGRNGFRISGAAQDDQLPRIVFHDAPQSLDDNLPGFFGCDGLPLGIDADAFLRVGSP